jgi:hypothetical protein
MRGRKYMNQMLVPSALKIVLVFSCVILFGHIAYTQKVSEIDGLDLTSFGKQAFNELSNENQFSLGGTGYAGTRSKGEKALDILIGEREPEKVLTHLASTNSGAGGLYALFGLRLVKSELYADAHGRYLKLPDQPERKATIGKLGVGVVERMEGCLLFHELRADVANEIDQGKFDFWIEEKIRIRKQK